ncbi:alkylhydroperoxidase [Bifidobacterium callitrichos]|uniref:Alkylhydroperoxidase n=1 Tax=Bifidobacterium callitrichos TaxID=762209 RepID=A0A5M9ZCW6_9BIFI|nr:zinc ribbon domain-containing protein [Bifidobacterium callitrichos]KAA8816447.1 alkylhydroperoxidase [Bifidobacterium callitrichos]
MPAKPGKAYRSYAVSMPLNRGKAMRLRVMLRPWRLGLRRTLLLLEDRLIRGERLPRYVDAKQWEGFSQRQWDSITRQARAMMDSWIELRVIDFRSIVSHSSLDDDMKRELWRINLRHAWWEPVDDEAHRMARRIMKHLRKRHRFPNPMRCRTLSMDGKIAEIQPSAMGGTFPYWARISTLDKGRPIHAPLDIHSDLNPHLDPRDPETLANHLQIRFDEDGGMTVRLMTTQDKAEPRVQGDVIGLDWGLSSLFATSEGRLYGLRLFAWLQQRDEELLALTRDLARSNVGYRDSKRFRRLNKRIHDHVTNEVNRVLDLIADDRVRELVVEDLDFRHGGLSKRLNRIVTRAGRNAVRAKLERLHALKGITITRVNPAYTSQECPRCGWTSPRNRPDREHFRCECCGYACNADIVAATNIKARRSRPEDWRWIGRHTILSRLRKEHAQRCPDRSHCPSRRPEYGSPTSAKAKAKTDTRVKKTTTS